MTRMGDEDRPAPPGRTYFIGHYPDGSMVIVELPYTVDLEALEEQGIPENPSNRPDDRTPAQTPDRQPRTQRACSGRAAGPGSSRGHCL
jgi:hypothetical protein